VSTTSNDSTIDCTNASACIGGIYCAGRTGDTGTCAAECCGLSCDDVYCSAASCSYSECR
jgi:hypothetical protein